MQALSVVRIIGSTLSSSKNVVTLRCATLSRCLSTILINENNYINKKMIHTTPIVTVAVSKFDNPDSYFNRTCEFLKYHLFQKYRLRAKGFFLYRFTVDRIDHVGIIKDYRLADTFFTWFLITELHVWMIMLRLQDAGREGPDLIKNLVAAMWQDADMRKKKLGKLRESKVREHMQEIGHQFNAAIIGYDEGIMTNDKILAGALWRRLFQSECNNPEHLERLVIYVHKTMKMLDDLPHETLFRPSQIKWIDHKTC